MAQVVKLKRTATSGKVPTTTDIDLGEVAINTHDGKVFIKKDDGTESIVDVIEDAGQLLKVTEGGNTGFRIKSEDPANHSDIGEGAVDLSTSDVSGSVFGAKGLSALATGYRVKADGDYSIAAGYLAAAAGGYAAAFNSGIANGARSIAVNSGTANGADTFAAGSGTIAQAASCFSIGKYNIGLNDSLFEIGNGTSGNTKNALTVYNDGTASLDDTTIALINSRGNKAAITKEYLADYVIKAFFSIYPSSVQAFDNSYITVEYDTIRENDSTFSLNTSTGEITINASNMYMIHLMHTNKDATSDRSTTQTTIEIDTGSGFTAINNFILYGYVRNATDGRNTAHGTVPLQLNDGDKLRVRTKENDNSGGCETEITGCNLTIMEM